MLSKVFEDIPVYRGNDAASHDIKAAEEAGTQLLYGEILPEGVMKLMDPEYLNANEAKVLLDIGSGRGRVIIQCFEQFKLERAIGVEISQDRFKACKVACERYYSYLRKQGQAVKRSCGLFPVKHSTITHLPNVSAGNLRSRRCAILTFLNNKSWNRYEFKDREQEKDLILHKRLRRSPVKAKPKHTLEFYNVDISKMETELSNSSIDIVVMDIAFTRMPDGIARILKNLKVGARVASYQNLKSKWNSKLYGPFLFVQYAMGHRFWTSWAPNAGHRFFLFRKASPEDLASLKIRSMMRSDSLYDEK